MTNEEADELAKRHYRLLERVANYMESIHREHIETQLNPSTLESCLRGLFFRATLWLLTMKKLNKASDLQALAGGTRALVEIAVDMLLIHGDGETGSSVERIHWWEQSAKLRAAGQIVELFGRQEREVPSEYKAQLDLVDNARAVIEEKRIEFWDGKHPSRWTGKNLLSDSRDVDKHNSEWLLNVFGLTLTEFYEAELRLMNWYIHGSTLAGFRNVSDETLTRLCARCYEASAHLGMICAHVIQSDYRLFGLFPEMQTKWESLLSGNDKRD